MPQNVTGALSRLAQPVFPHDDDARTAPNTGGRHFGTGVTSVGATGNVDVDSLLATVKWGGAVGTGVTVTYSFMTDQSSFIAGYTEPTNHFRPLTDAQEIAARAAFQYWSNVANINFVEVTDDAGTHGDIRLGRSAQPATAWAYYPSTDERGGDIWLGDYYHGDSVSYPQGSYTFHTMIHEIGHAIGLKHPHDGGGTGITQTATQDWLGTSVMSYRSGPGTSTSGGYTNSFYPAQPMLNDIQAIQHLYGANTGWHAGNDTYSWSTGARIFQTIYDAGGSDTIDWSNQSSAATIDLRAGAWSNLGPAYTWSGGSTPTTLAIARNTTIENANGGSAADQITGNAVANRLSSNGGDDVLIGGGGNDALDGGSGTGDVAVFSGTRSQYVISSSGSSFVVSQSGGNRSDGTDTLTGIEQAQFSDQTIVLVTTRDDYAANTGTTGRVTVGGSVTGEIETAGDADWFRVTLVAGQTYRFLLEGTETGGGTLADPYLYLHNAAGELITSNDDGGGVRNSLIVHTATTSGYVYLSARDYGDDDIGSYRLSVQGSGATPGDDFLVGTSGNDTLSGLAGNDRLQGGLGNDRLDGGSGTDTADYTDAGGAVTVSLASGSSSGALGVDRLISIENLLGGGYADTLTGDAAINRLEGGAGNDTLRGGDANDLLYGGGDNDLLYGEAGSERIYGETGDDTISGGDGYDTVSGGDGRDRIWGDAGRDRLWGDAGNDDVYGGTDIDEVYGGLGNDLLDGGSSNDLLYGNEGNDTLYGGTGADRIDGGAGMDTVSYYGETDPISLVLDDGSGSVSTPTGTDQLIGVERARGTEQSDTLYAADGTQSVSLFGLSGNDRITGGAGNDELAGNDGNDTIKDGRGNDLLDGGAGNDVMYFAAGNDSLTGGTGTDTAQVGFASSGYSWARSSGKWIVTDVNAANGSTGTDTLYQVERLVFTDRTVTLS